jgi:3-oxoacyl-[acyl-carrier-protein] synthase III
LNIGVYRESNIHEPALAALIQRQLGLNTGKLWARGQEPQKTTLSFDLLNGACGFFNAIQLATSFIETSATGAVLVVASDVHPSGKPQPDFPYAHLGAAMLLTPSDDGTGFHELEHHTSEGDYIGSRAFADITQPGGARGHLDFEIDAAYSERLNEFAVSALSRYLERRNLDVDALKYAILATPERSLSRKLLQLLDLNPKQVIDFRPRYGNAFSSAPILGYHTAQEHGLMSGDQLLFLSAGAGLTFACGLYRV